MFVKGILEPFEAVMGDVDELGILHNMIQMVGASVSAWIRVACWASSPLAPPLHSGCAGTVGTNTVCSPCTLP